MGENILLLDDVDLSNLELDITEFLFLLSDYKVSSEVEKYYERIFDVLKIIYMDENYRHSYYEISQFLENELQSDQQDLLSETILKIYDEANRLNQEDPSYKNLVKNIGKLSDHISLELLRIGRMKQINFIGDKLKEQITENKDSMYRYKKKSEKLESKIKGFHSQSITILGIFSGLVFTFVTSGNLVLEAVIAVSGSNALHKVVYITLIVGFIIFNLVYMLMYSISKISGNSMATECSGKQCLSCGTCQTPIGRLKKKYPLVFWFNSIILFVIVVMTIFYILNEATWFQNWLHELGFKMNSKNK